MDYRTLGHSGCAVSSLCLGTMTFGVETDEPGSHEQLDRFIEAGGTLVDTADVYGKGQSEEIIGRWFASRPADVTERVVLASKGRFPLGNDPNSLGLSTRHLTRALDASLSRLGLAAPVTLQPQYSLIVREIEWEIVPAVQDAGMGMLPWSPLGGGWLSGKYQRDERPTGATRLGEDPDRGMEAWERRGTERTWNIIDAVQKVAEDRGVSMAEVALAWVIDRPAVTSTILGARTTEQLDTNLRAADLHLTDDETAALDQASDLHASDYPYGELGINQRSRDLSGP